MVIHSAGGRHGWTSAIKSDKVKVVIALELGTFPFSENELPKVEETTSPFPAVEQKISMSDFMKLTKIPIVIYFGDNIVKSSEFVGPNKWYTELEMAKKFVEAVNRHSGQVELIELKKIGIKGNTHFLMSDLNNEEMANRLHKRDWTNNDCLTAAVNFPLSYACWDLFST